VDVRPCPNCYRTGRLMSATSEVSTLKYYRCDLCGEVWVLEKDVFEQPARPQTLTRTGIDCPQCFQPIAVQENRTESYVVFWCPNCDHRWAAREPIDKAN